MNEVYLFHFNFKLQRSSFLQDASLKYESYMDYKYTGVHFLFKNFFDLELLLK